MACAGSGSVSGMVAGANWRRRTPVRRPVGVGSPRKAGRGRGPLGRLCAVVDLPEDEGEEECGWDGEGDGDGDGGGYPLRETLDVWRRKKQLNALDAVGRAYLEVMGEAMRSPSASMALDGEGVIERVGARAGLARGRALLAPLRLCVTGRMAGPKLPGLIEGVLRSRERGEVEGELAELAEVLREERADAAVPRVRALRREVDAGMLVVSKPGSLLSHRRSDATVREKAEGLFLNTLVERQGLVESKAHLVNRLDRGTSGVVVVGVDAGAAKRLQRALGEAETDKQYLVLCRGQTPEGRFDSDAPLTDRDNGEVRACRTEFETLAHFPEGRVSLVRATLRTGRRHQIRRHLGKLAHHVVGDSAYGKGRDNAYARIHFALRPSRMFLHAYRLKVRVHGEESGEASSVVVVDPLPRDLTKVLMRLPGDPPRRARLDLLADLWRDQR